MNGEAKFWDNIAAKYVAQPVKDVPSWDETLERTRAHLNASDEVLELGAGTGSSALRLHDAVKSYRATDFSKEMIGFANEKLAKSDAQNLTFAVGEIADEPSESYDAILAFNVLHLVDDLPQVLNDVARALKPGGVFISKSGCIAGKYAALKLPIWVMQRIGKAPYVNYFSAQRLQDMIMAAGFDIKETKSIPSGSMIELVIAEKT